MTNRTGERGDRRMRKQLHAARTERGMTQQQMADKINVTLRYYKKLEYGEALGAINLWDSLEDLLGVHQRKLRCDTTDSP